MNCNKRLIYLFSNCISIFPFGLAFTVTSEGHGYKTLHTLTVLDVPGYFPLPNLHVYLKVTFLSEYIDIEVCGLLGICAPIAASLPSTL